MLDREEVLAARSYLKGWLEAAKIRDVDLAQRFVTAALDAEDPELAFSGAQSFGVKRLGQGELVPLAEALRAIGEVRLSQQVREALDLETLKDHPLLLAADAVDQGVPEAARQLLSRVQVDGLDEWRLALWAQLMESARQRAIQADMARPAVAQPALPVVAPQRGLRRFKGPPASRSRYAKRKQQAPQPVQPAPALPPPAATKADPYLPKAIQFPPPGG